MRLLMVMMAMVLGCDGPIDSVSMRGMVTVNQDEIAGLAGACLTIVDRSGEVYNHTTTSESGSFMVDIPSEQTVYALVSAEGHLTASFTGSAGALPGLNTEVGQLHGMSKEDAAEWRQLFAGCPGAESGGFVVGEVILKDMVDTVFGDPVVVTTAYAVAENQAGDEFEACYLMNEGDAWNPDAFNSGETGQFAIFGLDEGLYVLTVGYTMLGAEVYQISWEMLVPHDGVVPRFPIWVESVL